MTAKIPAGAFVLDLYHIDQLSVVPKYIGETGKYLEEVLCRDEAPEQVISFKDADALLGQWSAMPYVHDRYANEDIS